MPQAPPDQVEDADGKIHTFGLPTRNIGRPEDIAAAILFLMANRFVTGEVLHVDGGGRLV
ncbi:SDR family oxidoreductase [Phyllobacterium salinisoli]|uniref:SDR family oxidoreductase n=1 Tax=Phyllobacterium salinisoli TaxID=1899321 RepID=UPI003CCB0847